MPQADGISGHAFWSPTATITEATIHGSSKERARDKGLQPLVPSRTLRKQTPLIIWRFWVEETSCQIQTSMAI